MNGLTDDTKVDTAEYSAGDVQTPSNDARSRRRQAIEERITRSVARFGLLPDDALVEIRVVEIVRGRSRASTWRDVSAGRLAQPVRIGSSTRWRVGDVRKSIG